MRRLVLVVLCILSPAAAAQERQALPHQVGGVALAAERSAAEERLGPLRCRDSRAGFLVCTVAEAGKQPVPELELFIYENRIVSMSYAEKRPNNAWQLLDGMIQKYGQPALTGVRERDRQGRMHEVFGWKDEKTIYSLRFVWDESSQLSAAISTLWDRDKYRRWESAVGLDKAQ